MGIGLAELVYLLVVLAIFVVCGIAAMSIAAGKGRDATGEKVGWFLLGFFFPLIGLIIALVIRPRERST